MTQVIINDIFPYTQAIAILNQTVYSTNWTANVASDVVVYSTPFGDTPDDVTQILTSNQYSVAFIGDELEVQVTLITPSAAGDIITITRQTPADRLNLYSNTNFTPNMLNNDFGILTLVDQQAQLVNQVVAPRYNYSALINVPVDTILPILGPNETWVKNNADTGIVTYTLPTNGVAPLDATYITFTNETSDLPNSLQLLAGNNVTLIQSTGTLTINVTGQAINPGTANDLAYYASNGSVLSPLATADNGVLVTDNSGVPSISATLPSAVQNNITLLGTLAEALNVGTHLINNVIDPISAQDAATKNYVDTMIAIDAVLLNPSADQIISNHSLTLTAGSYISGSASGGFAGSILLYPITAANGGFVISAVNNPANFPTRLRNSAVGQDTTISLPDPGAATANVLLDASATGHSINYRLTMPSIAFSSTSGIIGTTTNDNAPAGSVGYFNSSSIVIGSAVSLTTGTATNITSISLPAGDYDVWADIHFTGGNTTLVLDLIGWISTTSATLPAPHLYNIVNYAAAGLTPFNNASVGFNTQQIRLSLPTTTTVYLSAFADFSISTCSGFGNIRARSAR